MCDNSAFVSTVPSVSTSRAETRDINLHLDSHKKALRESLYRALAAAVRGIRPGESSTRRILDIGCGRGELLQVLASQGMLATGLDADSACVAIASRHARCVHGTIADAPRVFGRGLFDTIVASHVLEHLPDPFQALTILRDMGAAEYMFAVPNLHRPRRLLLAIAGSARCDHPRHLQSWGRPELQALLAESGFADFRWYTDRVTVNPLSGTLGFLIDHLIQPIETRVLPRLLPGLSSSLIVSCRPGTRRRSTSSQEERRGKEGLSYA